MQASAQLKELLHSINRKSYPAYKSLRGAYQFDRYILSIDHVQGDPFASPSHISVKLSHRDTGFPAEYYKDSLTRITLGDFLNRQFEQQVNRYTFRAKGSGKSGLISVSHCGQEVLARTACEITEKGITARFFIGFPANGRTINSPELEKILFDFLPVCIHKAFFYRNLDPEALRKAICLAEDQAFIRQELKKRSLAAFVSDGAILPRESGISSRPMKNSVPFISPESLRVSMDLPHRGTITGMGIPCGKLALYTACAGIAPEKTLPVVLDVGTNREEYLNDPLYLGLRQKRCRGPEYRQLVDEFIAEARRRWPNVLIQFEDFGNANAFKLLSDYQEKILCFNDDIQGTASVVVSGMYSAVRVKGEKMADQKFLFFGAGEAACGIANLLADALIDDGLSREDALAHCYLFDSKGLVTKARTDLAAHKQPFAVDAPDTASFLEAVKTLKPTAIIGVAGQPQTFTKEVLEEMAKLNERPIIFALSNPTSKAECTAEQAYTATKGKALFASGSPFDPVEYEGKTFVPRQGNNSYVFPALGLGAVFSRSKWMPDGMFLVAAKVLATLVSDADLAQGSLYPALSDIRPVSVKIGAAVAAYAYEHGLAQNERPADLEKAVDEFMYRP